MALAYAQVASIASLGLETALLHSGARAPEQLRMLARRALLAALAQGAVAAVGGWIVLRTAFGTEVSPVQGALAFAAVAAPALLVLAHGHAVLRAAGRLVEAAVLEVVSAVSTMAVVIVAVATDRLWLACVGAAAGTAISALLTIVLLLRVPGRSNAPAPRWSTLLRYGAAGHVGTVIQNLNYRVDVFVVALFLTTTDVGVYAVAVSLAEGLLLLPNAMGAVVMQRAALRRTGYRATAVTLRLGLAVAVTGGLGLAAGSRWLVPAVFGDEFSGATSAIVALLPGIVALVVWKTLVNDLAGRGHPGIKSISAGVALIATLSGGLLLIPPFGIVGAAAASSAAYTAAATVAARRYHSVIGRSLRELVAGQ